MTNIIPLSKKMTIPNPNGPGELSFEPSTVSFDVNIVVTEEHVTFTLKLVDDANEYSFITNPDWNFSVNREGVSKTILTNAKQIRDFQKDMNKLQQDLQKLIQKEADQADIDAKQEEIRVLSSNVPVRQYATEDFATIATYVDFQTLSLTDPAGIAWITDQDFTFGKISTFI